MILENINQPSDIKKVDPADYGCLAEEIRRFLIDKISMTGGHLASNLGVVELTMALHLVFDLPEDKIVWDVGHQSYTHKLLTGRKEGFEELRQYGGLSGFPKRKESSCDAFDTGHSSTSISAGLGLAKARDLRGEHYSVISVIGDGALTGGMAFEALNNAEKLKSNFIIVLNDNQMSISENIGGVSRYLSKVRTDSGYNEFKENLAEVLTKIPGIGEKLVTQLVRTKSSIKQLFIPGMLFENFGVTYLGPVDGHNIKDMMRILQEARRLNRAVLVHVVTKKGMGYKPAEMQPSKFHGVEPFDIKTGKCKAAKTAATYTDIFSVAMCKLAERHENLVAISAAMPDGTGLKKFSVKFPNRFFDVGIAEEHAVTFAAGLAAGGMHPVVAVYSSFLQRAYDQILHDVCIQNLPVIFAVDRAGLVGSDGETHQGIFDLSYLSGIPNMSIFAPKNKYELVDILEFAMKFDHPLAIRYPRGTAYSGLKEIRTPIAYGKSEVIARNGGIVLLAVGSMVKTAMEVKEMLEAEGRDVSVINVRFVKPIDTEILDSLAEDHRLLVTMEENVASGGYGEQVCSYVLDRGYPVRVLPISLPDTYVEHGNVEILKKEAGIDAASIAERIRRHAGSDTASAAAGK
ncbi:1-deoxy-D-xylulose-5-phosphate synthase [Lachnotalea sp. AF33-28]|uniref:1-deoxy-D-xylulose-5-phosphate synthase n=1 Tax=Lachnotalea sp. AF33-28 TaxID=2292046 RepID=UPI000E4D16F8|nr:1-deoxy-D-xylulose-5-phosphate synthase [Lachnotalea sp. AF33-28]RHP33304.1 1-deoxy-D-xylulose-5-phosphate synthase [Lachnotalea sp. AF33-28]